MAVLDMLDFEPMTIAARVATCKPTSLIELCFQQDHLRSKLRRNFPHHLKLLTIKIKTWKHHSFSELVNVGMQHQALTKLLSDIFKEPVTRHHATQCLPILNFGMSKWPPVRQISFKSEAAKKRLETQAVTSS